MHRELRHIVIDPIIAALPQKLKTMPLRSSHLYWISLILLLSLASGTRNSHSDNKNILEAEFTLYSLEGNTKNNTLDVINNYLSGSWQCTEVYPKNKKNEIHLDITWAFYPLEGVVSRIDPCIDEPIEDSFYVYNFQEAIVDGSMKSLIFIHAKSQDESSPVWKGRLDLHDTSHMTLNQFHRENILIFELKKVNRTDKGVHHRREIIAPTAE